jgi:hypothetical protein
VLTPRKPSCVIRRDVTAQKYITLQLYTIGVGRCGMSCCESLMTTPKNNARMAVKFTARGSAWRGVGKMLLWFILALSRVPFLL